MACTTSEAAALVTHRGIQLSGMRIDGDLDLTDAQVLFPLNARKRAFEGNICLTAARLRSLYLGAVRVKDLIADGARIEGRVFLCDGFKADGEVNFLEATIGGDLKCSDAQFFNPEGQPLIADRAKIEGDVSLSNGFKSRGEVSFPGVTIGRGICRFDRYQGEGRSELRGCNGSKPFRLDRRPLATRGKTGSPVCEGRYRVG
jgi:hypothetical protein